MPEKQISFSRSLRPQRPEDRNPESRPQGKRTGQKPPSQHKDEDQGQGAPGHFRLSLGEPRGRGNQGGGSPLDFSEDDEKQGLGQNDNGESAI